MSDMETLREYNRVFFAVKGMLIPESYSEYDMIEMYDSYVRRLWGNHERLSYSRDEFEKLWSERNADR
jgi:hypothetical protein